MKKLSLTLLISAISFFSFGQNWQAVGLGINNEIFALDSANGLLYVGGSFDTAGGIEANSIATWNGSSWSALGSGLTGGSYPEVYAISQYNGNIVAGGIFITAGGQTAHNIAMWNGSTWSALGTGFNGAVVSLAEYKGNLYAGGYFDSAGTVPASYIAMWNGATWVAVGKGLSYYAETLAVYDSILYAGGGTNNNHPGLSKWNGVAWDSLPGLFYFINTPCYTIGILSLTVKNGLLYTGGLFCDTIGPSGIDQYNLGVRNDSAWLGYSNAPTTGIYTLYTYNNVLLAGGDDVYVYDTSWTKLGNGIANCTNLAVCGCAGGQFVLPDISAIAGYGGHIYAGGGISTQYGNPANFIEEYSGVVDINELSSSNSFTVYPNPSTGIFTIKSSVASSKSSAVEVYNMLGEKIYTQYSIPTTQYQIDLSSQSSGIYLYRIIGNDGACVASGKLVKE